MRRPRTGTLIVKTSDATVDVVLRDQLRHLSTTSLAPVTVAAGDTGRLAGVGRREGVAVHALPFTRHPSPLRDLHTVVELARLMARLRPALVVYGTPKATLLAGVVALCTGVPARVQVLHGLRLETTSGIGRRLLLLTERLAIRTATHTVAVGHGLRARCAELGLDVRSMSVIGQGSVVGIDVDRARRLADTGTARADGRASLGASDDELVVGFVGRVTRDKGVEALVRAAVRLRATGLPVRLAIVGLDEGVDALDDDVRAALRSSWVTMTGNVADPAPLYPAFDAFCLPSHREGLSTVLLEAWAAGIPVVVSDCTGLGDVVEDDVTGIVVPVGDVDATVTGLRAVLTDDALRTRLAARATAHVTEHFARDEVWARCVAFYEAARDERAR
ncbi:glycosyltransferase [Curtobacterium sp. RRHDQ10]|uniref:glycosyltransferase n=1 Tax=Curtobacterium phyllosphaerae TaxID=3413379 RepID=UPI003BF30154